jgi:hypothetical protein
VVAFLGAPPLIDIELAGTSVMGGQWRRTTSTCSICPAFSAATSITDMDRGHAKSVFTMRTFEDTTPVGGSGLVRKFAHRTPQTRWSVGCVARVTTIMSQVRSKGMHDRARHGPCPLRVNMSSDRRAWACCLTSRNPDGQTVTLVLDTTTVNAVMFAVAAHADECEAHIREVQNYAQTLPEDLLRPTKPPRHRQPRRRARLSDGH